MITKKTTSKGKARRTIKSAGLRGTISRKRIAKAVREVAEKHA